MTRVIKTLMVILVLVVVTGCRKGTVRNVDNAPVVTQSSEYSLDEVGNAIARAGSSLGWRMRDVGPGHILGILELRAHTAEIDISYGLNEYSINYKDSDNLNYSKGRIHSNYNGWIQNLERTINNELSRL